MEIAAHREGKETVVKRVVDDKEQEGFDLDWGWEVSSSGRGNERGVSTGSPGQLQVAEGYPV